MVKFETMLREALQHVDARQLQERLKVYDASRKALSKLDEARYRQLAPQLHAAITSIERSYGDPGASVEDPAGDGPPQAPDARVDGMPEQAAHPFMAGTDPGHLDEIPIDGDEARHESVTGEEREAAPARTAGSRKVAIGLGLLLVGIAAASLAVAIWSQLSADSGVSADAVTNGGTGGVAAESDPIATLVELDFPQNLEKLITGAVGNAPEAGAFDGHVEGGKLLINGDFQFYSLDMFPVDTSKAYLMRLVLEIVSKGESMPSINAGFATYDADRLFQTSPPGTNRYFVNIGKITVEPSSINPSEIVLSGLITGEGDASHDMMRVGTRFARAYAGFRWEEGDAILAVRRIEVLELQ